MALDSGGWKPDKVGSARFGEEMVDDLVAGKGLGEVTLALRLCRPWPLVRNGNARTLEIGAGAYQLYFIRFISDQGTEGLADVEARCKDTALKSSTSFWTGSVSQSTVCWNPSTELENHRMKVVCEVKKAQVCLSHCPRYDRIAARLPDR